MPGSILAGRARMKRALAPEPEGRPGRLALMTTLGRLLALSIVLVACTSAAQPPPPGSPLPSPSSPPTTSSPPPDPSPGPAGDPAGLAGREFLSVRVMRGDDQIDLVDGTRISVSFAAGQLGIRAGCNIMGGSYAVEGGTLVTDALAMTEMGCDQARHEQDDWISTFFGQRPAIALSGDDLVLTFDDTAMTLLDREIADPDLPLAGTTWLVDSLVTGESVSSVPIAAVSTFRFSDDGRVDIDTGCNLGGGRYEVDEGAGTIRFSDLVFTRRACSGAGGELEGAVMQVLAEGTLSIDIEARRLELRVGRIGLGLRGS